eukprot:g4624.t1
MQSGALLNLYAMAAYDSSSSSDGGGGYGYVPPCNFGYPYPVVQPPYPNGYPYPHPQPPESGSNSSESNLADESWSRTELKRECWRNGHRRFNHFNNATLILLVNGERIPDEFWTKRELRQECCNRSIRNFGRLNKGALIRLLNTGERPAPRPRQSFETSPSPDSNSNGSTGRSQETVSPPPIHNGAAHTGHGYYLGAVHARETLANPNESGHYGVRPDEASTSASASASASPYSYERTGHSKENKVFESGARRCEASGKRSHDDSSNNGNKKHKKTNDPNTCIVCMDNEVNCTLVPCGHHCTCINCAAEFVQCPVCRRDIDQKIKTFTA